MTLARFFWLAVLAFLVYWVLKGTIRRLFGISGQKQKSGGRVSERPMQQVPPERRRPGIDYSKVRDADFRDLD